MKKLRLLLLLPLILLTSCSEGNYVAQTETQFDHIHVQMNDKIFHDDIIGYKYFESGPVIKVNTKTYGWILLNQGYMLYNSDKCPLCNK